MDTKVNKNVNPVRCKLDEQECVSIQDLLVSFQNTISEEHVWALCFQCARSYKNVLYSKDVPNQPKDTPMSVTNLAHVRLHKDGYVHETTMFPTRKDPSREPVTSEHKLVMDLGQTLYWVLDFGFSEDQERVLSTEMGQLIDAMTIEDAVTLEDRLPETDDEGIERDSDEIDLSSGPWSSSGHGKTLGRVLELCEQHIGSGAVQHYRAVCRALVAEGLELSTFLMRVSQGTKDLRLQDTTTTCADLDSLNHVEWARFWMQVIGELRMGVKLKKVNFSRAPIEYELTPYEILMDDIRSRRYKLKKIMVDGIIPHRVKKDAHAVILEFIRSRPPLKKASERQLAPLKKSLTPREKLLDSIKSGRSLRPTSEVSPKHKNLTPSVTGEIPKQDVTDSQNPPKPTRRLIKVDFSLLQINDDDDDDDDLIGSPVEATPPEPTPRQPQRKPETHNPWRRTAYDLATQCPSRRASMRRHTIVACGGGSMYNNDPGGSQSVPQSRPASRQSVESSEADFPGIQGAQELTWSRTSLQDELVQSVSRVKQWQEAMSLDERLSLTLEEIVHIRSVLTKAELEGLPVEGRVKEDVEKRKVCFLCLKTRFGIFGPWGQRCKLCKRTVCSKCHSKMRIPTEHFRNVPVVLLSPSLGSPGQSSPPSPSPEAPPTSGYQTHAHSSLSSQGHMDESFPRSLMARLLLPDIESKSRNSVGSAPSSPNKGRMCGAGDSRITGHGVSGGGDPMTRSMEGPRSLPPASPRHGSQTLDRRSRFARATTLAPGVSDRIRGEQMSVCHDCKGLVLQIIRSSRPTRSALRNNAIRNLTLNLAPVY